MKLVEKHMIYTPKKISKPWGHELWLADGDRTPYATKLIHFKAGNRTSLQVHKFKYETTYVTNGFGKLLVSIEPFDISKFLLNGMTNEEILAFEEKMKSIDLYPNMLFDIKPNYVHRIIATTDLDFIESSTIELDDVIRIQDDNGRGNGKIINEHIGY